MVTWENVELNSIKPTKLDEDKEFLIFMTLRKGKFYTLVDSYNECPIDNMNFGKLNATNILIKPKYISWFDFVENRIAKAYDAVISKGFFGYEENKVRFMVSAIPCASFLVKITENNKDEKLLYCEAYVEHIVIAKAIIPKGSLFYLNNETGSLSTSRFYINQIIYEV